jgi:hypothetical protein
VQSLHIANIDISKLLTFHQLEMGDDVCKPGDSGPGLLPVLSCHREGWLEFGRLDSSIAPDGRASGCSSYDTAK